MSDVIDCDATAIGMFKDCPRKFDLRINQGLVPKGQSGGGRAFGCVMHKGRGVWRNSLMAGKSHRVALTEALDALAAEWHLLYSGGILPTESRTLENAERLFRGYAAKFAGQAYIPLSSETPFAVDAGVTPAGHTVRRTGIMDEYCEFGGRRYVLDFKTSGRDYPGGAWMDAWRTAEQFLGYVFAARQLYGACEGVIVHGMWVHTPPKRSGKYAFEDYFTADIITFSDSHIEEWHRDFLRTIDRREAARAADDWSPNSGSACKTVYGLCDYHKWCSSTPEIRPQITNIYYEKRLWQPLEAQRLGEVIVENAAT